MSLVPLSSGRAQDTALVIPLQNASRIRVESANGTRLEERFQELTPTYLRFRATVRPTVQRAYVTNMEIPRDSLSRIWVRDGSRWRTGAMVGGAAFGVLGFLVGFKYEPSCGGAVCVVGATAAFGAVGAFTGALGGALVIRWRPVWPP